MPQRRTAFGAPGELAGAMPFDPSKKMSAKRERIVQTMLRREVTWQEVREMVGCGERTARGYLVDPRILRRLRWLLDSRLQLLASEAVEAAATIMRESNDDRVRLRAASEIMDRAGLTPPEAQEEQTAPFQVTVLLGTDQSLDRDAIDAVGGDLPEEQPGERQLFLPEEDEAEIYDPDPDPEVQLN